jgi:hypothetical protein
MPSKFADICLEEFKKNKKKTLVNYYEKVDHDGFNSYGPKSILWDLYIFYLDDTGCTMVDFYHREEWFLSGEQEKYLWCGMYNLMEFKYGDKVWCKNNRKVCEVLGI